MWQHTRARRRDAEIAAEELAPRKSASALCECGREWIDHDIRDGEYVCRATGCRAYREPQLVVALIESIPDEF